MRDEATASTDEWDLPVTPPVAPMLASPAGDTVPSSDGLAFEPKWDGFRMLVFRSGGRILLQGRSGDDLTYAFPEVASALLEGLPERIVLDGEVVIAHDGVLDFTTLGSRLRPRSDVDTVSRLAREHPATYVGFDLLALGDEALLERTYLQRRSALDALAATRSVPVSPMTRDRDVAVTWFHEFEGGGLDGLIAKPIESPYSAGKRTLLKIKHRRTVDTVVAGWRAHAKNPDEVGSLLLGLYDSEGLLHHVGAASGFSAARRREIAEHVAPHALAEGAEHPWLTNDDRVRRPGGINRWNRGRDQSWQPLAPDLVAEVAYDQFEGDRLRHVATLLRWRPDRTAASCTYAQVHVPAPVDITALLG